MRRALAKKKSTFCDLGCIVSLLYVFISYSIVALLLMVQTKDGNFLMMALVLIFIPIMPLLILLTVTQKRKIEPCSSMSTQTAHHENDEDLEKIFVIQIV